MDGAHVLGAEQVARYAGMVANPPPYMVMISAAAATKRTTLPIRPANGTAT